MGKRKVDWDSNAVLSIVNDETISLEDKAVKLGVSIWYLCRQMKRLGIKHNRYWKTGLGRPTTNKERKARYNAKRKAIGWKYLYQV